MCRWIVSVSPTFAGNRIAIHLSVSDARGFGIGEETVTLKARATIPRLSFSYKMIDKNGKRIDGAGNGFIENGDEGKLEVIVTNKGNAAAKDVKIAVHSTSVYFVRSQAKMDKIGAQSKGKSRVFDFQIPRFLGNDPADVNISITQKYFSEMQDTISISHRPFTP